MSKMTKTMKENYTKNKEYLWFIIGITAIMVVVLLITQSALRKPDLTDATLVLNDAVKDDKMPNRDHINDAGGAVIEKSQSNVKKNTEKTDQTIRNNVGEEVKPTEASVIGKEEEGVLGTSIEFVMPVNGTVIKPFSNGELVYSKTLMDYRVHNGVDIRAGKGEQVVAIANGTVIANYNDFYYGITIEIDHGNGIVSKYMGLSTQEMVPVGKQVAAGDIISGIGETALIEAGDEYHLHFEVWQNGEVKDPKEWIGTLN